MMANLFTHWTHLLLLLACAVAIRARGRGADDVRDFAGAITVPASRAIAETEEASGSFILCAVRAKPVLAILQTPAMAATHIRCHLHSLLSGIGCARAVTVRTFFCLAISTDDAAGAVADLADVLAEVAIPGTTRGIEAAITQAGT